jgi:hypothetical protein
MQLKLEHPGWQPHNLQGRPAGRTRAAWFDDFVNNQPAQSTSSGYVTSLSCCPAAAWQAGKHK